MKSLLKKWLVYLFYLAMLIATIVLLTSEDGVATAALEANDLVAPIYIVSDITPQLPIGINNV
ncbi:Uncharacterised protein [BD1-7 clade bacterium]|uniref:Uncharacterized protein n=1 Tax=BD1-7 clade bacterium TaxID=2029982 RepID=A0A5S9PP65_9GAMM|nr:Uncharacterised protein [BD1-7 clade bacterium]CAA0106235.1 Uncharacterised protein [BD1-7 clade bacterium]